MQSLQVPHYPPAFFWCRHKHAQQASTGWALCHLWPQQPQLEVGAAKPDLPPCWPMAISITSHTAMPAKASLPPLLQTSSKRQSRNECTVWEGKGWCIWLDPTLQPELTWAVHCTSKTAVPETHTYVCRELGHAAASILTHIRSTSARAMPDFTEHLSSPHWLVVTRRQRCNQWSSQLLSAYAAPI